MKIRVVSEVVIPSGIQMSHFVTEFLSVLKCN